MLTHFALIQMDVMLNYSFAETGSFFYANEMKAGFDTAHNVQIALLSTQTAQPNCKSRTFLSLRQIQLGLCCLSTQLK